ncbi:MAG: hypothetical protein HYY25_06510 [Candidatus Wallbacteria bacterium]|nr:hypothetical protein [Candidatus Wallbacteria bacterium]
MGTQIEINDTLKLTAERGFPVSPEVGQTYDFSLPGARLFHRPPVRVFLVEELGGKWKFAGHALIVSQTIDSEADRTSGRFRILKLYDAEYARLATLHESPPGKSYY